MIFVKKEIEIKMMEMFKKIKEGTGVCNDVCTDVCPPKAKKYSNNRQLTIDTPKTMKKTNSNTNPKDLYNSFNQSQLKLICKDRNLKQTGKKPTLIQRLKIKDTQEKFFITEGELNEKKILKQQVFFYDKDLQLYLSSFTIKVAKKRYKYILDKDKEKITHKINIITNQVENLLVEDIHDCKSRNLPFDIPIVIEGNHKKRKINQEQDENDDLFYEILEELT